MNISTYSLRKIAIAPPASLISILTSWTGIKGVKPPLGRRQKITESKEGTINMVHLRSDAIFLLQITLK